MILLVACASLFGPYFTPSPAKTNLDRTLEGPSWSHPLGTDQLGRDILGRVLHGGRLSLSIGLIVVGIAFSIGATLGLLAGYFRGAFDFVVMRLTELVMAFPSLLLALLVIIVLGTGLFQTMVAVGITYVPRFLRISRASALSLSEREYVIAARAVGSSDLRILRLHIFPNALAPLIVEATITVGTAILIAASLSFLGLGVRPPTPEWGNMLSEGRDYMSVAPHLVAFPGLSILLTVLGFNLMGDALRDAVDVKFID